MNARRRSGLVFALAALSGLPLRAIQEEPERFAFVGVNVVPMDTERVLFSQTVLVEGGRIEAIGHSSETRVPEGTPSVEGNGRYLIPGLHDLHVHLSDEGDLTAYLAHGVTTVRNLMGTPWHLEVRELLRSGELLGPRFFTSGPFVNEPRVRTPDEARAAVAQHETLGYDCIKIHGSLSMATYRALLQAAHEAGIPVVGHAPRNLAMEEVLAAAGQADISHGEEYLYTFFDRADVDADAGSMGRIARATMEAGVAVVPNLIAYLLIARQVEDLERELAVPELAWVSPLMRRTWSAEYNKYKQSFSPSDAVRLYRRYGFLERFTKTLSDTGVTLLLGSDALNPTAVPGFSAQQELALLVSAKLTPYEALRTATSAAGAFLHGREGAGTVAVGEAADLVLIAGNPLEDIASTARVEGVMVGGEWLPKTVLVERMQELTALYAAETRFMQQVDIKGLDRAEAHYRRAKQEDAEARVFREEGIASVAVVYATIGDTATSLRAAELGLEEYPHSWRAHVRLAEALFAHGDTALAIETLEAAQELHPDGDTLRRLLEMWSLEAD